MEINLNFLKKHKLTPNQFVILQLLYEKNSSKKTKEAFEEFGINWTTDLDKLVSRGFVEKGSRAYKITEDYLEIIQGKGIFEELLTYYPVSVVRQDGTKDYLRINQPGCKRKYLRITRRRRDIHEHIIKCLKFEVEERKKFGTLKWMKRLPKWLDENGWQEWSMKMKENKSPIIEENNYGTELE